MSQALALNLPIKLWKWISLKMNYNLVEFNFLQRDHMRTERIIEQQILNWTKNKN